VPWFHGGYAGPHGRLWWGPGYGWRVPVYWGGYYRPYWGYWGLSFWVTDWIMLDYLAAEEARIVAYGGADAVAVPATSAPVEYGVREELRAQVADILATPAPAGAGTTLTPGNTLVVSDPRIARALGASHHVFVVSRGVTVTDRTGGGTCALTQGDLLRSSSAIPSGQSMVDIAVAASKKGSCAPGAIVALPVADLVRFEEALIERVTRGAAAAKAAETEGAQEPSAPPAGAPAPSAPAAPSASGVSL
jgi:hypothetical protein